MDNNLIDIKTISRISNIHTYILKHTEIIITFSISNIYNSLKVKIKYPQNNNKKV